MKFILNDQEVREFVAANKYKVDEKTKFISRCIDGRYPTSPKLRWASPNGDNLPASAIAGADAGELAVVFAASFSYGLEYDKEKVFKALCSVVGGVSNLRMHTDDHAESGEFLGGCGHIRLIKKDPALYSLDSEDLKFIKEKLEVSVKNGAKESVLHGKHEEVVVFLVTGKYGIFPQCKLETNGVVRNTQVFIFHQSLVDERHKKLADLLVQNKAVTLPEGCDGEYLYSAISETTENHLMETLHKLVKGLAIYQVSFEDDGNFSIEKIGKV